MVSYNALRCGAFNGEGRCDDRVQWYDVCGTVVRCHGACVVRWYGAMVRWYGAMGRRYGAMPHCTNLLHQCTPVHPSHCTEKIAAKTRFFATKTCVFADKKAFFCYQKMVQWAGCSGTVDWYPGTVVGYKSVDMYHWNRTIAPLHRTIAPLHRTIAPLHRTIAPPKSMFRTIRGTCFWTRMKTLEFS